ncbi:MAG: hypothetical protein NVSMB9_17600 [Isosphaeraceae bacterium]
MSNRSSMPPRRFRVRRLALIVVAILIPIGVAFRRPIFQNNFGVIEPGRVYRSAQPRGDWLARLYRERGIGSVLNLRGGSSADDYYNNEVQQTRALGIDFYDLPMNASRRPSRRELLVLIDLFRRCRYPILIHCKSGSDRTGLASALYLMAIAGKEPEQAEREFTLTHGHFNLFGRRLLHAPFLEYNAWLKKRGLSHSRERLLAWLEHDFVSPEPEPAFRALRPGPRDSLARKASPQSLLKRTH